MLSPFKVIALTVSAFMLCVIPCLGLLGAIMESRCLLVSYIVFLTLGAIIKLIVCSFFISVATHNEVSSFLFSFFYLF